MLILCGVYVSHCLACVDYEYKPSRDSLFRGCWSHCYRGSELIIGVLRLRLKWVVLITARFYGLPNILENMGAVFGI